jgi:peptidylprolyl isomerase
MKGNLLFAAIFAAGVLVLGGFYVLTSTPASNAQDASGPATMVAPIDADAPVLVIEVAGEANGSIEIQLFPDVAPNHVERLVTLAEGGAYDGVVFHRVIEGFMAQSGDVQYGQSSGDTSRAGMGASNLPDLKAEFSDLAFERGVLGMARSSSPHSANSQFFIMFAPAPHLNGQYTVVGQVVAGLDVLDQIKLGRGPNGSVIGEPDVMKTVRLRQ